MRFALERVTQPDIEPVTLTEMKRALRMYDSVTSEDADVTALIKGARQWVEHETSRALIDQQWRLTIGETLSIDTTQDSVRGYYCGVLRPRAREILLRRSPVIAVVSFVSVDSEGVETAVDPATYALREGDSKWPRLVGLAGATWGTGTYRVVFRAGYADRDSSPQEDASVVPECFKQAMKLWSWANYEHDDQMEKQLEVAACLVKQERCNLDFA